MSSARPRTSILDKPLSRGKGEVSLSSFALLFSEVVQYSQSRVYTVPELQNRCVNSGTLYVHCAVHININVIRLLSLKQYSNQLQIT